MSAIIEVKYFNTYILKKTLSQGGAESPMWNGSRGIPQSIGGYPRTSPLAPDNNDQGNWSIEESRIRGGYNNTSTGYGAKAYLVEDEPNAANRINTLIYSGIYNARTGINDTNVFSVGEPITKSLDPANGSIQKLYAEDTNLNIFQELKVSRALIDKDAIYSAEGGGTVTSSNLVIGAIQPYAGEYGISKNPESFAVYGYNKYFADMNKNVILSLGGSGIQEISSVGMKDFFRDELNRIKVAGNPGRVLGGWDIYTQQYILSTQKNFKIASPLASRQPNYRTVSWDERIKGWTSFFSFKPDQLFSIRNNMYTTKDGGLWLHNSNTNSISQARVNEAGGVVNQSTFSIDNVNGTIQVGDLVTGIGVPMGTVVSTYADPVITLNKACTLSDNSTLIFNSNLRSKFYNVSYPSSVTLIFNDQPSISKTFKTIEYEGSSGWMVESFSSDFTGQDFIDEEESFMSTQDTTDQFISNERISIWSYIEGQYDGQGQTFPANLTQPIYRAGFDRKENKYVANLINRSKATPGEVHFGEDISGIKGFYSVVKMQTDGSTDFGGEKQLFQVGTNYKLNNGY